MGFTGIDDGYISGVRINSFVGDGRFDRVRLHRHSEIKGVILCQKHVKR